MSFAMVLKMFADCSLSFAILGMVETEFPVPLLIPAVLYAVSAGLAAFFEDKNRPVLRRLCALLPWGCLLFGSNVLQILSACCCLDRFRALYCVGNFFNFVCNL